MASPRILAVALGPFLIVSAGHVSRAWAERRIPSCEEYAEFAGLSNWDADENLQRYFGLTMSEMSDEDITILYSAAMACASESPDRMMSNYQDAAKNINDLRGKRDKVVLLPESQNKMTSLLLKKLKKLDEEIDILPETTQSLTRLDDIVNNELQDIVAMDHAISSRSRGVGGWTSPIRKPVEALKIHARDRGLEIRQFIYLREFKQLKSRASAALISESSIVDSLDLPQDYMDATIIMEDRGKPEAWLTLREFAAVVYASRKFESVKEIEVPQDSLYGVAFKKAGLRSVGFLFSLDGGELFVSALTEGDHRQEVDASQARAMATHMIRSFTQDLQ